MRQSDSDPRRCDPSLSTATAGMATVGSETQFAHIHRLFRKKIERYLARFIGQDEAEDLAQDVFVKVNQGLAEFRGESNVSTWIYRIAKNVVVDRLRSVGSASHLAKELSDKIAADEAPPAVEQQVIRREMNECIRQFVANLPADYRSVIILSELNELSNREIAEVLGLSLDTVKIRLHRARAWLRVELASGCNFYRDDRNELACEPSVARVSFYDRPPSIRSRKGVKDHEG